MCFHAMMLCWALSEKHWLFTPFSWLGDWLEDWGFRRGYIGFSDQFLAELEEAKAGGVATQQTQNHIGDATEMV